MYGYCTRMAIAHKQGIVFRGYGILLIALLSCVRHPRVGARYSVAVTDIFFGKVIDMS